MSRPRLLVVTSVHHPDDARIRSKLINTLAAEWDVTYAAPEPGPRNPAGLEWVPLTGGRLDRLIQAVRLMGRDSWDLVALHDPELLVGGLPRSRRGEATLFDLHENLPAQLRTRERTPPFLRRPLAAVAGWALHLAENSMAITLAEPGYQELFRTEHPIIANYLPASLPDPRPAASPPFMAYLGDVTVVRGAFLAIEAAAGAGHSLVMVGRVVPGTLAEPLARRADELGVELELVGPLPHAEALERVAAASVGLSPLEDIGNYRHSLPTKVPEYLALGLPVITSDLPGTREPIADLDGVTFVNPGDVPGWREAGRSVAEDLTIRERTMRQVDLVRERFTWPGEDVLAVYREAARL
ncbi:MAG TPA: glycosyltransferase [Acidimicrobiia bacterium]|nr:glycosyltransferase [Acidimicrobiia bacterium]